MTTDDDPEEHDPEEHDPTTLPPPPGTPPPGTSQPGSSGRHASSGPPSDRPPPAPDDGPRHARTEPGPADDTGPGPDPAGEQPAVDEPSWAVLARGDVVAKRYKVDKLLGGGGLGRVYLAEHLALKETKVTLKGLKNPHNPDHQRVVVNELRALETSHHPNIVSVFDVVGYSHQRVGTTGTDRVEIDYIVMEYVDGMTLSELRREHPDDGENLSIVSAVEYVLDVLAALEHLHEKRGLLYNDLSPDNVMIGPDERVTLIDLGSVSPREQRDGLWFNKVGYRDPFSSTPSPQTDIYACGVTLAVLTGQPPGFDPRRPPPPRHGRHESFHLLLDRATQPDPALRFGSVREMADQLKAVLREERALQKKTRQPGASLVFGPEVRVELGTVETFPELPPDRVAWALALPDTQVDRHDPHAWLFTTSTASLTERLQAVNEQGPSREVRLRDLRAGLERCPRQEEAPELDAIRTALATLHADDPADVRAPWMSGVAALIAGEASVARAHFSEVRSLVPGEAAPRLALGLCAEVLGDHGEAARHYRAVWCTDAGYISAAFGLARAEATLGQRKTAVEVLDEVPPHTRYAVDAALIMVGLTEPPDVTDDEQARRYLAAATRLDPQRPDPLPRDDVRRRRMVVRVFEVAAEWLEHRRSRPHDRGAPGHDRLIGVDLTEDGVREGLRDALLDLASHPDVGHPERIALVDRANHTRRWSWW